jgi:serine/threonine protein phosphatase PrpC
MGGVPAGDYASGVAVSLMSERERNRLLEKASGPDRAVLEKIGSVFNQAREIPLNKFAVEDATGELLLLMNRMIEETVQTHPTILAKARPYFLEKFGKEYDDTNPAHKAIMEKVLSTIGTTGTMTKIWNDADGQTYVTAGSVGDSRAYILRGGRMIQLTNDHSPLQTLLNAQLKDENGVVIDGNDIEKTISKEEITRLAEDHSELQQLVHRVSRTPGARVAIKDIRNMMYLALGGGTFAKKEMGIDFVPSISTHRLLRGDKIILATDGLIDNVSDRGIAITTQTYDGDPESAARALQEEATEVSASNGVRAKKDDVTVLVQEYT